MQLKPTFFIVLFLLINLRLVSGQNPAVLPYEQNFTNNNDFTFVNGTQTNKWAYGIATGNTGRSIYISDNNGVNNNYIRTSTSTIHAYKDFVIPAGNTIATLSFDWKSNGEANNDYLRVWLVPVNYNLAGGTEITAGAGRIQVGGDFGQQNNWQNYFNANLNVINFAGNTMRLVFQWRNNNNNAGNQSPAAIDNIRLIVCSDAVPIVAIGAITDDSASATWPQDRGGASYSIRYRRAGVNAAWTIVNIPAIPNPAVNNNFNLINLLPATLYEVEVAAVCNNVPGNYSHSEFTTRCDPTPSNITINNITTNSALITWLPLPSTSYVLRYRISGTGAAGWSPNINLPAAPASTYSLMALNPGMTYDVQIANICDGDIIINPWSNVHVFTTERICEDQPLGLTINQLAPTSAEVVWNPYPTATYLLRYRKVGIPSWINIPTIINTHTLTGLIELTQYEMQVANVCNGVVGDFTPLYLFTTPTVVHCPMFSDNANGEFISNVTVKPNGKLEMENTSGPSVYTDYTGSVDKFIKLIQGSTGNEISIEKSANDNEGIAVWIDFDRNGRFDLNERILSSASNTTTPIITKFSVPEDAFVSMSDSKYIVMRVAMQRDGIPVNCTNFANGEVEDYAVMISKKIVPNSLNQDDILIYPNPVSTILNVKNINKEADFKIYNSTGQLISQGTILNNKIDVSRLLNGVYIIDIENEGQSIHKKFIKEN